MSRLAPSTPKPPARRQRTLAGPVEVAGVGFVTESDVRLRFLPAEADRGVSFRRVDLPDRPEVPARIEHVIPRSRRTTLQRGPAVVEMVEHVMAALAGLRIDNCTVELDAAETPGLDGSSLGYVEAIAEAGAIEQDRPRASIVIDRPVAVRDGLASIAAYPGGSEGLVLAYQLDYPEYPSIGAQSRFLEVSPDRFRDEIAPCRTFLLDREADTLRAAGLGRRLGESDLLIYAPDGPLGNRVRFPDECVRHKLLDMVGDLALAGVDLIGHVVAHRSGHAQNAALVRAILDAQADNLPDVEAATAALDIDAVMAMMPHRYPFLLIDRVVRIEPRERVVAIKNVTINEPFFQGHWPGRPIMPGVLILEALAQAAGILIGHAFEGAEGDALLAGIDEARIRRPVVPGDQVRLEVECRRLSPRLTEMIGVARVDGQVVAEAKLRFVLAPRKGAA